MRSKSTRFLFNEWKQTPEGMVSVSQIQSFMSCPKKWEYGYMENITPRIDRPYLSIGKLCHKGMQTAMQYKWVHEHDVGYYREDALRAAKIAIMDEHAKYIKDNAFLAEELPDIEQIGVDAEKVFEQAFWEFDTDRYEVQTVYINGTAVPALELHFAVPCSPAKALHGYIDAILRDKETGFVWCVDYKFRKSLSPDEDEATNIQNAVYAYACRRMGIEITGTMTWQHLNTPAAEPQVLKNGTLSRAKIKTTWSRYAECCVKNGLDPEQYREEMEPKLADIEWFRATYEYRNEDTVKRMWHDCIVPATRAIKKSFNPRAIKSRNLYPWNCKMCQFKDLCQAELRGYDAQYVRDSQYVLRSHVRVDNKPIDE